MTRQESDRRAAKGEPFVLRFRVPRESTRSLAFDDLVYRRQSRQIADVEDFALLRSDGSPTYHLASTVDDIELKISHVIRRQDQLMPYVESELREASLWDPAYENARKQWLSNTTDLLRARYTTLKDFSSKGHAYFGDTFDIEPRARKNLDKEGAWELLHELAERLVSLDDFSAENVEEQVRGLAAERDVKPGLIINAARAALTGQSVGPSAFAVFAALGRDEQSKG